MFNTNIEFDVTSIDVNHMNDSLSDYQVYVSVSDVYDIHDANGDYIESMESDELMYWFENQ
jgi:hypothetical protein